MIDLFNLLILVLMIGVAISVCIWR